MEGKYLNFLLDMVCFIRLLWLFGTMTRQTLMKGYAFFHCKQVFSFEESVEAPLNKANENIPFV